MVMWGYVGLVEVIAGVQMQVVYEVEGCQESEILAPRKENQRKGSRECNGDCVDILVERIQGIRGG